MILPDYMKVKDEPNLVRDVQTNALLATSVKEKRDFIERQKRELNIRQLDTTVQRIDRLENDVADIKSMLKDLINKLDHTLKES